MKIKSIALIAVLLVVGIFNARPADASIYTYVGSWRVDQTTVVSFSGYAYTFSGQAAAAYLFGGNASDYVVSTVDSNPNDINFSNWISTWGGACNGTYPCGTVVADTFVKSELSRALLNFVKRSLP